MAFERRNISPTQAAIVLNAASTTVNTPVITDGFGNGMLIFINVTAISGTSPTLTVTLKGYDPVSQQTYVILTSAAITATGFTVLRVYPSLTAVANATANDVVPPDFKITAAIAGTTPSVTATISYAVID